MPSNPALEERNPAHFRPARWLQWRFYFSHSAPTPLLNLLPGTLPATNTFKSQVFVWLLQDRLLLKDTEGKHPRKPNPCKRCNYDGGLITLHVVLIIDMDEFYLRRSCGSQRRVECGGELDCSGKAVLGQPLDSSDKKKYADSQGKVISTEQQRGRDRKSAQGPWSRQRVQEGILSVMQ